MNLNNEIIRLYARSWRLPEHIEEVVIERTKAEEPDLIDIEVLVEEHITLLYLETCVPSKLVERIWKEVEWTDEETEVHASELRVNHGKASELAG
jgi:hypothetical protein